MCIHMYMLVYTYISVNIHIYMYIYQYREHATQMKNVGVSSLLHKYARSDAASAVEGTQKVIFDIVYLRTFMYVHTYSYLYSHVYVCIHICINMDNLMQLQRWRAHRR